MQKEKRLTLNSEKRTAIANVFQSHFEREESPVMKKYYDLFLYTEGLEPISSANANYIDQIKNGFELIKKSNLSKINIIGTKYFTQTGNYDTPFIQFIHNLKTVTYFSLIFQ